MTDKANNSHDLHDDSKKRNDQPIISKNETDHTINVSAQSAQTQQSSTNDAEQPTNISTADRVVNDQTDDDFADPVREENNASRGSNSLSNRSKPDSGKIINVNLKTPQNGFNEAVRGQSVATHPAKTSFKMFTNEKSCQA